ncbi:MAG TPA: hypothetical protein VLJ59_00755 [Mycobacteriales bacterium]|nr:hypothetical protein [Mycobacteriales bacterium]
MSKRAIWIFVAYVVFFAWLDWIMHRSIVFIVVVGGGLIVAALYKSRIGKAITTAEWPRPIVEAWEKLSPRVRQLLVSLTPLLYFLIRGQGTSNAGIVVVLASLVVAGGVIFLGQAIDSRLKDFYAARNRVLARGPRMVLAPILGIVIAFLVVHGSLGDLPALFGGETTSRQSPAGLDGHFFLATLLAGACTVLLLREGGEQQ